MTCLRASTPIMLAGLSAVLAVVGASHAEAPRFATEGAGPLVKPDGSPPLVMPNTLLVESGDPRSLEATAVIPSTLHAPSDAPKRSPRICSAAAVRVPQQGIRIVTARHCADHRNLEVLDEDHHLTPVRQVDAAGEVDLAVLEVEGKIPWQGFEMRAAGKVQVGERLCAWRLWRSSTGIGRDRICARLVGRQERAGADALLVMNHPYPAGTSGSALVDADGRVVGIVVASTGEGGLAEPIEGVLKLAPPPTLAAADSRKPQRR
jgi:hypothetical protein